MKSTNVNPENAAPKRSRYYVYILECSDRTLYTGWTGDVEKRVSRHNRGRQGAKYTRSRRPVKLVYVERCGGLTEVLRREARIKKLSRQEKLRLIAQAAKQRGKSSSSP